MPKEYNDNFYSYVSLSDQSGCRLNSNGIDAKSKEHVDINPTMADGKKKLRRQILRGSPFIRSRRDRERARMEARRRLAKGQTGIRLFEVAIPFNRNLQKKRVYFRGVEGWMALSSTRSKTHHAKGSSRGEYLFVASIPSEYIREISWRT